MNTTNPVRPEPVEGLDLRATLDFESLRSAHIALINTKSFETNNQVHELMLLYALQINDLSCGIAVLRSPISTEVQLLQQSQWVLLRAMFEATIKLSYLCCDPEMTQARFNELEYDGLDAQLKSMKAMRASFPDEQKADIAIASEEAKFNELKRNNNLQKIPVLKMEKRLKDMCDFYENAELANILNIFWMRSCAVSHSRPSELKMMFLNSESNFQADIYCFAARFLAMAGKFLNDLPDKKSST